MNIILFEQMPPNFTIGLDDYRGNHIRKILKLQKGDTCNMGICNQRAFKARIMEIDSHGIRFAIEQELPIAKASPSALLVGQVRPISMKRILREATSLGIGSIIVVGTDTSERSYRNAKLWNTQEAHTYLISGAMQSAQIWVPELLLYDSLEEFLSQPSCWERHILLDNELLGKPLSFFASSPLSYIVAIGSERGWSKRERDLFLDFGYETASLGPRVLRTETACTAALAILNSSWE
ncbi:MAG: 16S rRNA (uracil(1498)-N(3))-methyltransferase [Sphaerochaetaceae bacterium]